MVIWFLWSFTLHCIQKFVCDIMLMFIFIFCFSLLFYLDSQNHVHKLHLKCSWVSNNSKWFYCINWINLFRCNLYRSHRVQDALSLVHNFAYCVQLFKMSGVRFLRLHSKWIHYIFLWLILLFLFRIWKIRYGFLLKEKNFCVKLRGINCSKILKMNSKKKVHLYILPYECRWIDDGLTKTSVYFFPV